MTRYVGSKVHVPVNFGIASVDIHFECILYLSRLYGCLGGCDLEGASQYVNYLTHPYMLKISQMIDVRLDEFERIKKLLL